MISLSLGRIFFSGRVDLMSRNQIDGQARHTGSRIDLMLEAKSTSVRCRRRLPFHWVHVLLAVVLVVSAVKVPHFLVTFIALVV